MKVLGEGPIPARIMLIGEAPGANEDREGRPFVGKAGQELDRMLEFAGLDRSQIYITNLVKYRPPDNRDPLPEEIEKAEAELLREIFEVNPEVIGCVGRISSGWALGDKEFDIHVNHGMLIPSPLGIPIMPIVHPSAGLHSPSEQQYTLWDLCRLAVRPKLREDQQEGNYYEVVTRAEVEQYLDRDCGNPKYVAIDTEGYAGEAPWGFSISGMAGSGIVIKAGSEEAIDVIRERASRYVWIMHNSPHDINDLLHYGIVITNFIDTMELAYLLRIEPQGLKELAERHLGMKIPHFMEVVREAQNKIAISYLKRIATKFGCDVCDGTGVVLKSKLVKKTQKEVLSKKKCGACEGRGTALPKPEPRQIWEGGKWRMYAPQAVTSRLNTLLASDNPYRDWHNIPDDVRAPVEAKLGKMRRATLDDIPYLEGIRYSGRDSDVTLRVFEVLQPQVKRTKLQTVSELDHAAIAPIVNMMRVGMKIDRDHFARLSMKLENERLAVTKRIQRTIGQDINPGSDEQICELLFVKLGLKAKKLTKSRTRASVDAKVLEELKLRYSHEPIVGRLLDDIIEYRSIEKLKGTYVDAIPLLADPDDRIHTDITYTRTESGRYSSKDPNLQNLPKRPKPGQNLVNELTKGIRLGFIPEAGRVLGSWDLNQIEMRVLAALSGDKNLIAIFRDKVDIHTRTAALVFRVPESEVTADQRLSAKNIGFGVVYGVTAAGLRDQMSLRGQNWTLEECQQLIDLYLNEAYPEVGLFMKDAALEARKFGYVRDYFGRIRYLPSVGCVDPRIKAEGERQAANHKIQATAAGILKLAMTHIHNEVLPQLRKRGWVEMLMTVHDELLFEFDPHLLPQLHTAVLDSFANHTVKGWPVEIASEGACGKSWGVLGDKESKIKEMIAA